MTYQEMTEIFTAGNQLQRGGNDAAAELNYTVVQVLALKEAAPFLILWAQARADSALIKTRQGDEKGDHEYRNLLDSLGALIASSDNAAVELSDTYGQVAWSYAESLTRRNKFSLAETIANEALTFLSQVAKVNRSETVALLIAKVGEAHLEHNNLCRAAETLETAANMLKEFNSKGAAAINILKLRIELYERRGGWDGERLRSATLLPAAAGGGN